MNKTYTYEIPNAQQNLARVLSICSGKIYSKTVRLKWRLWNKKGLSISLKTLEKYIDNYYSKIKDFPMHSQSKQAAY